MNPHQVNALFTILALDTGISGGIFIMVFLRMITRK